LNKPLLVLYQNVRGLRSKLADFYFNSCITSYDVICLTETWLHTNILDTELFCDDFSIFQLDRVNKRGGGVLIAVHSKLSAQILPFNNSMDVEFIAAKIQVNLSYVYVCCSYVPPNSDSSTYTQYADLISGVVSSMR
jgi:exonuclease III